MDFALENITMGLTVVGVYFIGAMLSVLLRNAIGAPIFGFRRMKFENQRFNGNPAGADEDILMMITWPVTIVAFDVGRLLLAVPLLLTKRVILLSNKAGDRIEEIKYRYITGGRNV